MSDDYNENKTETAPIVDPDEELCSQILEEWDKGRSYIDELDDMYEDLYRMLRGERPEKNYDWESNLVINKVFQVVWTAIPYVIQKIFGASPIMGIGPNDNEGAKQREKLLEFWHTLQPGNSKNHTPYFNLMVMWLLRALLNGTAFVKKGWNQKLHTVSEKTTQEVIPTEIDDAGNEISVEPYTKVRKVKVPVEDWPYNIVVNNKDIVTDWLLSPTQSCRQGRFVIHRSVQDLNSLKSSPINYINLDKIMRSSSDSTEQEDHADLRSLDGQEQRPTSDIYADIETYERVGEWPVRKSGEQGVQWESVPVDDIDDDTIYKHMAITVAKCKGEKTNLTCIRFEKNPYDEINYIDMHMYYDAERWQSIGMVEPIKDQQIAINDNINAAFDEIWQNMFPPVIVNSGALWDWDTMQYAPRQRWLVKGNPHESILPIQPSNITSDAWRKHQLLDSEIQLTTVSNSMQGASKEKTATTNVMNAQLTAAKLDFLVQMVEKTALIPSAQMDLRFAKKFGHPMTFIAILGKPFQRGGWEDAYQYIPAASSVKLEYQKEVENQENIQMMGLVQGIQNPNTPKVLNILLQEIFDNRGKRDVGKLLDEEYFEPSSPAGAAQMLGKSMAGAESNEQGIKMSGQEQNVRKNANDSGAFGKPRLMAGGV